LASLIVQHPEVLDELDAHLRSGLLADVSSSILCAIGDAAGQGSAAAAQELAGLIGDPAAGNELRVQALIASHMAGAQGGALVGAVESVLREPDAGLRSTAALLAGTLAGALSGDPEAAARLTAALDDIRSQAASDGTFDLYLDALGNTRDPARVAEALHHVNRDEPAVRESACRALAHLDTPESTALLVARASDPLEQTEVRLAAAASLGAHAANDGTVSSLASIAMIDPSREVCAAAIESLARHFGAPGVADSLAWIAANASDAQVREYAANIIEANH
jgi:hypothetical protein